MPRQYDQPSGGDWSPMTEQLELTGAVSLLNGGTDNDNNRSMH